MRPQNERERCTVLKTMQCFRREYEKVTPFTAEKESHLLPRASVQNLGTLRSDASKFVRGHLVFPSAPDHYR